MQIGRKVAGRSRGRRIARADTFRRAVAVRSTRAVDSVIAEVALVARSANAMVAELAAITVRTAGTVLGSIGGLLGHLGTLTGGLWPSWECLGPSWGDLGASWAVLEPRKAEKAIMPKTFKSYMNINDVCLLGPSWEASWGVLEASGAVWRPCRASLSDISATRGPFGASKMAQDGSKRASESPRRPPRCLKIA